MFRRRTHDTKDDDLPGPSSLSSERGFASNRSGFVVVNVPEGGWFDLPLFALESFVSRAHEELDLFGLADLDSHRVGTDFPLGDILAPEGHRESECEKSGACKQCSSCWLHFVVPAFRANAVQGNTRWGRWEMY